MVANFQHAVHVVSVDNGGHVELVGNFLDELVDYNGGFGVEAAVGLVAEEVLGVHRNGARDGDTLLHTARNFTGELVVGALQADVVHAELDTGVFLVFGHGGEHVEWEANVLCDRETVKQGAALEDHANFLAQLLLTVHRHAAQRLVVVVDAALVGLVQPQDGL